MNGLNQVLEQIATNNVRIDRYKVKKILIIYEEKDLFIGDSCIMFDKFKVSKRFFSNASVDINFNIKKYTACYRALLKFNPNVDNIHDLEWDEINYTYYDLVICMTHQEEALLKIIGEKHEEDFRKKTFNTSVFSLSRQIIANLENEKVVFPFYEELFEFSAGNLGPMELYVDKEESLQANTWLRNKGLKEDEKLLIILDSTSVRSKLLKMMVYYELLIWFLKFPNTKILIFDESNIGKEKFYKELLGPIVPQKFIFSNGLGLRRDIALLSSDKIKLIFGPCTGLMHCASGIYNNFLRTGVAGHNIPLLVTYTGKYHKESENANYWWSNAPLMNCMIIRETNGRKEMVLLNELTEDEKHSTSGILDCSEYTSKMILSFLSKNLKLNETVVAELEAAVIR